MSPAWADGNCFAAKFPYPRPQTVEPADVRLGDAPVGLAEEQRLDMADPLGAAHIPEKSAGEQGIAAALREFLYGQHAGALVVSGDCRGRPGRPAPNDQDVDVPRVVLGH